MNLYPEFCKHVFVVGICVTFCIKFLSYVFWRTCGFFWCETSESSVFWLQHTPLLILKSNNFCTTFCFFLGGEVIFFSFCLVFEDAIAPSHPPFLSGFQPGQLLLSVSFIALDRHVSIPIELEIWLEVEARYGTAGPEVKKHCLCVTLNHRGWPLIADQRLQSAVTQF